MRIKQVNLNSLKPRMQWTVNMLGYMVICAIYKTNDDKYIMNVCKTKDNVTDKTAYIITEDTYKYYLRNSNLTSMEKERRYNRCMDLAAQHPDLVQFYINGAKKYEEK